MIRYKCEACLTEIEAPDSQCGKVAECPECKHPMTVPLPEWLPSLECPYCEEHTWNALTEEQAGTMIKCPNCKHMVRIPGASKGCSFTACILLLVGITMSLVTWSIMR